ncbi:hypothetical protein [Ketobacter alkanivorans]|uniref:Uncharacterized protein n=1 Tax=Ketobacter alkanivorans TaxID=1917421 RepID=A0A2K9LJD6_9GAMM|nr:hypothetical protein [Ketobacter alkanivorans]AUM12291.1 hypothetical protein Kalk_07635 [Ketobacter alkanivorans]
MNENQYNESAGNGFILSRKGNRKIEGKYVVKDIINQEINDPFGNTQVFKRIEYITVTFSISSDPGLFIHLYNPPRKIRPFIDAMSGICGLGFGISSLSIEPLKLIKELEHKLGYSKITYIECSGINVDNKATAKVVLNSEEDSRKSLKSFIKDSYYKVNKLKAKFDNAEFSGDLEIRSNGSVTYADFPERFIVPILKSSL